ncbi:hypothetical protein I6I76_01250 [Dermacoccus nishinomiyaensis]|uniref:DUF5336 domain-containing protein n=1 Tax=Dermacoccus nishinomiyaensis TaxID=1274 RepID=UPI000DFE6FC3|nr:DUF5336 domain-containing protein [Dermacoccus nishinomiyaensis]QQY24829.1 hypothetical protein I6I76_01250 [Dermacoccus nishinomiyaensis]STD19157.1 Uncharacterised protein [Dermacoccus nishinomiyaensis]
MTDNTTPEGGSSRIDGASEREVARNDTSDRSVDQNDARLDGGYAQAHEQRGPQGRTGESASEYPSHTSQGQSYGQQSATRAEQGESHDSQRWQDASGPHSAAWQDGRPYGQQQPQPGQHDAHQQGQQYGLQGHAFSNHGFQNSPHDQQAGAPFSSGGQWHASPGYQGQQGAGGGQYDQSAGGQYGQQGVPWGASDGRGPGAAPGNPWNAQGAPTNWNTKGAPAKGAAPLRQPDGTLHLGNSALAASLLAQLFVMLGCIGLWASVFGISASGMNGDGVFVLLFALAAAGLVGAFLAGKLPPKALWGAVVAAGLCALIGLIDAVNVGSYMAWGLVMVVFFSIIATAATVFGTLRR